MNENTDFDLERLNKIDRKSIIINYKEFIEKTGINPGRIAFMKHKQVGYTFDKNNNKIVFQKLISDSGESYKILKPGTQEHDKAQDKLWIKRY